MAQTLNFAIQVDQSQLPAAISQLQSGIQTQLRSGALQMGTMANGLSATMAGMNAMGVTPGSMGFAHAVAPGQVNYALGRQPFVDRTASILEFMNQAGGAVKMRASSIVAGMDANKIAPTIGSDSRWGGVGKAAVIGAAGLGGFLVAGPAGAYVGAKMDMTGMMGSMFAFSAGSALWGAGSNYAMKKAGIMSDQLTPEQLQKLTIERRGYADIAGTFMALGPQKYLPKLGQEINTTGNIKFGESIAKAFIDRKDFSIINYAAGKNPSYLADVLSSLAVTDRQGFQKYVAPLHSYAGANAAAAPEHLTKPFVSYVNQAELMAQAAGYSSVASKEYKANAAWLQGGGMAASAYKGPNVYQLMGRSMGTNMRMGKQFGSDFMNSLKTRAEKDLGLSPEERQWSGGNPGIASQYGSSVMGEMSTFGSPTSIAYAAMQNGGMGGDIYDTTSRAAGVFTNQREYVKFRLNYRDIVRSGGASDAVYRKNMLSIAKEVMAQSGGAFANKHEALRMMFMNNGMNDEQARVQAGMILDVGTTLVTKGGGGRVAIWDRLDPTARLPFMNKLVMGGQATDLKDAETKMRASNWSDSLVYKKGFELGGDSTSSYRFGAYMASGRTIDKKWGDSQYSELKRVGTTESDIFKISQMSPETQKEALMSKLYMGNVLENKWNIRNNAQLNTMIKLKNMGGDVLEEVTRASKIYQKENASDREKQLAFGTAAKLLDSWTTKDIESVLSSKFASRSDVESMEKERKSGNLHFSGPDGKGKAGEYDLDATTADIATNLRRAADGIEKYNKQNKGK